MNVKSLFTLERLAKMMERIKEIMLISNTDHSKPSMLLYIVNNIVNWVISDCLGQCSLCCSS